ncbi:complement receptor type 2-like [Ruditapes philippinarum]|uniref:complement receptor type 2-like n=1 Tax=Ruditapes philippinarum TaxID=129788 RepID=UPI00295A646A|nr:complement receptor type 2-like [Ruditapes philippinarum]
MTLLDVCKVMLASLLGAVCIKGECESPPVIQNAYNNLTDTPPYTQNTPTYNVGTIIQFACNEGYAMSGQNTMQCRIDGEWLPSTPPTCTVMDCGEFGSIQNADLFQDSASTERNHYSSVVQVTCLNGTGPLSRTITS